AGKQLDSLESMSEVLAKLPSVERVVVIPYAEREPGLARLGAAASRAILWQEFGSGSAPPEFALHPFNHPLYILYSSGTTGVPKCIVHGAGGTLLQHQKEHLLHTDLKRSDRLFYFTTCGWMMWNWLMSGLACGATLVLYDGSAFHPQPGVLWHMADEERITIFGTSAKYLAALEKSTFVPAQSVDLTALRTLLSTGSPLLPEGFDYVYRSVKSDLQLASISGGTDIVSCFALGCPTRPVYRGELQCRGLGMAVDIFDDAGRPLCCERGAPVGTAALPSMPIGRVKGGVELDEALQKEIRNAIRKQTTPRHVPAKIIAVPDIPRTLSGKVTELAVRNVIHGLPVKNVDALANAGALDYFRDLPDLQS